MRQYDSDNLFFVLGDMKSFLIRHKNDVLDEIGESKGQEYIDSRLLIEWSYGITKGMQYLSRKHIMHGDLAARNILIKSKIYDYFMVDTLFSYHML